MRHKIGYIIPSLFLGVILGWLFFHSPHQRPAKGDISSAGNKTTIWTCSMHPQIRMNAPGKCPICGMDLIPMVQNPSAIDSNAVTLSREAAELANVVTSKVIRQIPVREVRLYGKVQADERLLQSQVAHIPGRIDKLLVNFNGESVKEGQVLAQIYSPELVTAQQELLETVKTKDSQPEIYQAAREKLHQWMLTEEQIGEIEKSGKVKSTLEITSNTSGIVTAIRVKNGDHVSEGTILYDVADLSSLWVMFDAYESDLEFLRRGNKVSFSFQALPGKTYTGNIDFISPVIDPLTRVAKVRVEVDNSQRQLKPEMFATGIVSADVSSRHDLVIPRSAVLWTGKRSIVYIRQPGPEPVFRMREIELGPMLGEDYVVKDGLTDGEEVVTQGAFSIDASAQLEGKPSMMNSPETAR